jgi:ABC-type phosphate transport system permease subunit
MQVIDVLVRVMDPTQGAHIPSTGDNTALLLCICALILFSLGVALCVYYRKNTPHGTHAKTTHRTSSTLVSVSVLAVALFGVASGFAATALATGGGGLHRFFR